VPPADGVRAELRATLALALPLAGAQLAQVMMGFTAAAMMGRLGGDALAAGGLGTGLCFLVTLVLQGLLTSVGPLTAHAIGVGEAVRVGAIVGTALVIAAVLSLVGMLIVSHLYLFLAAVGHAPDLVAATGSYLGAAMWGMPAALGYAVLRGYLSAMSRTVPLLVVLVACLGLNVLFNYALIFGHFGFPALGIAGSGYANAAILWVQFAALASYVAWRRAGRGQRIFHAVLRPDRGAALGILKLGWPIGGIFALEAGFFSASGVLAGLLGTAALAAHQVALSVASINFMVPLAFSHAATVRVALASSAGHVPAARRAGTVAFACGVGFMAVMAMIMLVAPGRFVGLYLDRTDPANTAAVAVALQLLFIAALFQVFDGAQAIAAGALRGLRDTSVPLVIAVVGYWGIGFVAVWILAFPLGLGAPGLWSGLALGLAAVALPLCRRFLRLTAA
jgi:MATE family multidrug resistance protein